MVCCCKKSQCPVNLQLAQMERQLNELRRQLASAAKAPAQGKVARPPKKEALPWDWQFTQNDKGPRAKDTR